MSKMSQLDAELTSQAAQLGFHSIEEAEINGFKVDYEKQELVPDVDQAYSDKEEEEKKNKEAKQIEMVYECLGRAEDMIALIYKPEGKKYTDPLKDIKDKKIQDYYYQINSMCCELADRNIMPWQKEDEIGD